MIPFDITTRLAIFIHAINTFIEPFTVHALAISSSELLKDSHTFHNGQGQLLRGYVFLAGSGWLEIGAGGDGARCGIREDIGLGMHGSDHQQHVIALHKSLAITVQPSPSLAPISHPELSVYERMLTFSDR